MSRDLLNTKYVDNFDFLRNLVEIYQDPIQISLYISSNFKIYGVAKNDAFILESKIS